MSDSVDDGQLLVAWQRGDRDAGELLLARHHGRVFRFFRTKLPESAADLAQQTFLAALEGKQRIAADRSFRAYLLGIARNLLFGALRSRAPNVRHDAEQSLADLGLASAASDYALRQEKRLLLACLRQLPIDQQVALELYYWEDLSTPEIAAVLEVAEGTVRSRLARARDVLRERLQAAEAARTVTDTLRTEDEFDRWARGLSERDDGAPTP